MRSDDLNDLRGGVPERHGQRDEVGDLPAELCHYCGGHGEVAHHGSGDHAEIRSCPVCGTGERLRGSLIPNVREAPDAA